jgi:hypothetical protein
MRFFLFLSVLFSVACFALDYKIVFENEEMRVSRWKIAPHEEVGLHSDEYPAGVYALQSGVIIRVEKDGHTENVNFPAGQVVSRSADPREHISINPLDTPLEALMVEFKMTVAK